MGSAETAGLPEQITDRAIEAAEDDLLGHQDFVDRLLAIVQSTKTPTNVALFGRWGSGKTGISNRLEAELGKREALPDVEFAYFDAFKFARLPLLRRFLLQIAQSLGGEETAEKYNRLLYERKERVRLNRPIAPLIEWTARALLVLAGLIWLFDFLAYFVLTDEQLSVSLNLLAAVFPVLFPTSLVVILTAFGTKYLTASTVTETPDSEEQFEILFGRLLHEYRVGPGPEEKTLVVFVDELDRCSAVEVVRTLESIKTFLGEPGCIFIVAADRAVLEHALTQRARQATPRDLTNPYYSAGSAYLDKIFQYQINLPPLFPGRLTDFALRLLKTVGGVWDDVASKDDVVSILLPVTVRSPRRVKVLLNAFAQAFALAIARAESRKLDKQIRVRAREVAKLVGLQIEFPLFAADLRLTPDLPGLVLACADALATDGDPEMIEEMQGVPAVVRKRALAYATGKLATDDTLHAREPGDEEMRLAQGSDLLDYLRQTRLVPGPATDLVHLEGLGLPTGLDEALALELNDLALKNRPSLVVERLERISDQAERERAILRLRDLARESKGNDADNAMRALLLAFPTAEAGIPSVATHLLAAVVRYDQRRGLRVDEMPSALDLAILGRDLFVQRSILRRQEALEEPFRGYALNQAAALVDDHSRRLGQMLLEEIVETPDGASQRLAQANDALRERIAGEAAQALGDEIDRIESALANDEIPEGSLTELTDGLKRLVDSVGSVSESLLNAEIAANAEALMAPVLHKVSGETERERIAAALEHFGQAQTEAFDVGLARWLSHRQTPTFIAIGEKLNAERLGGGAAAELGEVLARLWREGAEEDLGEAGTGLAMIGRLRQQGVAVEPTRLIEEVRESFSGAVNDQVDLARQRARLGLLEELPRLDLIPAREAGDIVLGFAARTLTEQPVEGAGEEIAQFVQRCFAFAADEASIPQLESSRTALADSPWIAAQSPWQETIRLQIEAGLCRSDGDSPESPLTPKEIGELAKAHGPQFIPAAVLWLERFDPTPAQVAKGLRPLLRGALPPQLRAAVSNFAERQRPLGRYRLVKDIIEWPSVRNPPQSLLRALGIQGAAPEKVTTAIVERFTHATNNNQREAALHIWRAFAPRDAASRRILIKEVFIPLARRGVGGYRLCRKYLDLCKAPPRGTKGRLVATLEKAPRRQEGRSMRKRMESIGLVG